MAATSGATPRKFAEKIAMHNQKGAEEDAEFRKIMAECAAVKGSAAGSNTQIQTIHQQRVGPTTKDSLLDRKSAVMF